MARHRDQCRQSIALGVVLMGFVLSSGTSANADTDLLGFADFHNGSIQTSSMSITPGSLFSYNTTYGGSWRILNDGGGFTGTFDVPSAGTYELVVTHLSSLVVGGCRGDGYSPVTIRVNGEAVASNYDPAENHGGTHGFVSDIWEIEAQAGENTISWVAQDLCSHYWIQRIEITRSCAVLSPSVESFIPGINTVVGGVSGVALSPSGSRIYAAHWTDTSSDPIAVYSAASHALLDTMSYGRVHGNVVVSTDGRYVYAPTYYQGDVSRFDTSLGNARDTLSAGSWSSSIGLSPDGARLVVGGGQDGNNNNNERVSIYDVSGSSFALLNTIPLDDGVRGVTFAFSPDSNFAYVPTQRWDSPTARIYEVPLRASSGATGFVELGGSISGGVAVSGNLLFASDYDRHEVWVFDRTTLSFVSASAVPYAPGTLAMHPDGQHLFVGHADDNAISVMDISTGFVTTTLRGIQTPTDVVFSSSGEKAFVASYAPGGGVTVLDIGIGRCSGLDTPDRWKEFVALWDLYSNFSTAVALGHSLAGIILVFFPEPGTTGVGAALLYRQAISIELGIGISELLGDPPDPNYQAIYLPQTPVILIPGLQSLDPQHEASLQRNADVYAELAATLQAMLVTMERTAGARAANDEEWIQRQLEAFAGYGTRVRELLSEIAQMGEVVATVLSEMNIESPSISLSDIEDFQLGLLTNGLPEYEVEILELFGRTPDDVEAQVNSLASIDASWLVGRDVRDIEALQVKLLRRLLDATLPTENLRPIADPGPRQVTEECSSQAGADINIDGSNSFDADVGDELSFQWIDSQMNVLGSEPVLNLLLSLGEHQISLGVTDLAGDSDAETVSVRVVDSTPPAVAASLVPKGKVEKDEGRFRVAFSCSDACDTAPSARATLNGIPVPNGQLVKLEIDNHNEVKFRRRIVKLEAPSFTLEVECEDSAGNLATATAAPAFRPDHDRRRRHRRR